MVTSTTITTVKKQIVTVLTSALATAGADGGQLQVSYAWPGPTTKYETVFLGQHPETADIRVDQSNEIPTVQASRQSGREEYDLTITVWTFRPDLNPTDAETCEVRAEAIASLIYDEFADDPRIGLPATTVERCMVVSNDSTLFPWRDGGWACDWRVTVNVRSRLR